MVTAARFLYAQRWKDLQIPKMEEWLAKLMELAEMAKLRDFVKEKTLTKFIST